MKADLDKMFADSEPSDLDKIRITPIGLDFGQKQHEEAYNKAINIVESIQQDREDDYGDAYVSHESIAVFWSEYLKRKGDRHLDATDVAVMLSLMKVSRLAYKRKEDSFVDFAAYADFALQFESGK